MTTLLLPLSILLFLFFPILYAEDEQVIKALVTFMNKLQPPNNPPTDPNWGWNLTSDPCTHQWHGVRCYSNSKFVRNIVLEDSGFTGVLDSASLCTLEFLQVLSLKNNNLHGLISEEIGACKSLSLLYLSTNNFSGDIPLSVSELVNLKRIDLSDNNFTGDLPDMSGVSGLLSFRAQNNNFTGEIPNFDFSNLQELNVSNNNLQGPIPDVKGLFGADSFSGNPNLCGTPLPNVCPPSPPPLPKHHRKNRTLSHGFVVYSGYVILGVVLLLYLMFKVAMKLKGEKEESSKKKEMGGEEGSSNYRDNKGGETTSNELSRMIGVGSEYSLTSGEKLGTSVSTSLMVLWSPMVRTLKFEDLLRAPAELIGRGKHGSTYKVMMENNNNGVVLAVKRIKDWGISKEDFERRMQKVDQAKHPSVNPLLAYYCSHQEKLLVYEYQHNGSLFKKLHGSQGGKYNFDWGSRLNVAASIAEALAYMHEELRESGIAHGNLKSRNILFDNKMEPCLTEYGLMVVEDLQHHSFLSRTTSQNNRNPTYTTFKVDTFAFGVLLLELLTGKVVQNNGLDLAKWVNSVVREEWSVQVFDQCLVSEGVSEERMMNLLQIALKCINPSPNDRPSMSEVAVMTISLKEEEERSITFEP